MNEAGLPLSDANILAFPTDSVGTTVFSISKTDGTYLLNLTPNATYKLTISFIGYINIYKEIVIGEVNINSNFILLEDVNLLDEVVIEYASPIEFKKDTTTYQTDAFVSGKERKLREVLKKLPGVEVDREGNVKANGKKVTKVLVENKTFFNGRSKLAVNNIPANVIKEIQIIEDYHETAFLKGLEDSQDIVLNINLKEDKKNFYFGDIELGGGIKNRHIIHPSLFKYSPKFTINFIGDFNNTVEKSFSLSDYIGFEGGLNKENSATLFRSNISRFLRNKDFTSNRHLFGGINLQYNPNEKSEWRTFVIGIKDKTDSKTVNTYEYLADDTTEQRLLSNNNDNAILLGKVHYKYTPNRKTSLKLEGTVEENNLNVIGNNSTNSFNKTTAYANNNQNEYSSLKFKTIAEKQFSKAHTTSFHSNFNFMEEDQSTNWISEDNFFSPTIPIMDDLNFLVVQKEHSNTKLFNYDLKHYWIVNRKNHLYLDLGNEFLFEDRETKDFQILSNDVRNDFQDFFNDLDSHYTKTFANIEYKRILGNLVASLVLGYQNYFWKNKQLGEENRKTASNFLPQIKFKWDFNDKEALEASYMRTTQFPNFDQFTLGNRIRSFNSVFQGNTDLKLSSSDLASLSYRKYKAYGWSFFPTITYSKRNNSISGNSFFDGINSVFTPVNLDVENIRIEGRLRTSHNHKYWKVVLQSEYSYSKSNTLVSNELIENISQQALAAVEFKTNYEQYPNIEAAVNTTVNVNTTGNYKNTLTRTNLDFEVDYNVGNFQLKGDYTQTFFRNEFSHTTTNFNNINSSIFYQKENSPWGLGLKLYNIMDNRVNITSSFSSILFEENKTFTFPRSITFHVNYKL